MHRSKVVSEGREAIPIHELDALCAKSHVEAGQKYCAYRRILCVFVEFHADHEVPAMSCHFQYNSALCLSSLQITSELPHSEVASYSFKNKVSRGGKGEGISAKMQRPSI